MLLAMALMCLAASVLVSTLQWHGWQVPSSVPLALMVASGLVVLMALAGCAVPLR
jgi:hypothetical protein